MGVSLGVFAFNVKLGAIFSSYHDVLLSLLISQEKREKIKLIYSEHWLNSKIGNNDRIKWNLKWKIGFKNEAEHRTSFQIQIILSITRPFIWEFYICRCYFCRHMMWCDVMNSFTVEYGWKWFSRLHQKCVWWSALNCESSTIISLFCCCALLFKLFYVCIQCTYSNPSLMAIHA